MVFLVEVPKLEITDSEVYTVNHNLLNDISDEEMNILKTTLIYHILHSLSLKLVSNFCELEVSEITGRIKLLRITLKDLTLYFGLKLKIDWDSKAIVADIYQADTVSVSVVHDKGYKEVILDEIDERYKLFSLDLTVYPLELYSQIQHDFFTLNLDLFKYEKASRIVGDPTAKVKIVSDNRAITVNKKDNMLEKNKPYINFNTNISFMDFKTQVLYSLEKSNNYDIYFNKISIKVLDKIWDFADDIKIEKVNKKNEKKVTIITGHRTKEISRTFTCDDLYEVEVLGFIHDIEAKYNTALKVLKVNKSDTALDVLVNDFGLSANDICFELKR